MSTNLIPGKLYWLKAKCCLYAGNDIRSKEFTCPNQDTICMFISNVIHSLYDDYVLILVGGKVAHVGKSALAECDEVSCGANSG